MPRLIHLNGPPGIGKSTLARRYADRHPGVLDCDIDQLRAMVGGWQQDFDGAGALIRPAALALITAYLRQGRDVILPQLIANAAELAKFADAARVAGAGYLHLLLLDDKDAAIERFYRRSSTDALHEPVRSVVAAAGGADALGRIHDQLVRLALATPGTVTIASLEDDVDHTYGRVEDALSQLR